MKKRKFVAPIKIGFIHLFGQEWEEWKKHNKPISILIGELKKEECEKIYMDISIKEDGFPEIERMSLKDLLETIVYKTLDIHHLIIKGKSNENDEKEFYKKLSEATEIIDCHIDPISFKNPRRDRTTLISFDSLCYK